MTNKSDRRNGLIGDLGIKKAVKVATTEEITLEGIQTIDTVLLVEGDRVLVKNQTTLTENGIYDVSSGSWTRSLDFDGNGDVVNGTLIYIISGSVNIKRLYATSVSNPVTIGASNIEFIFAVAFGDSGLVSSNNLSDVPNKTTARDNLGLEIGVDIPSYFDVSKYSSGNFYVDSSNSANTYTLTKASSLVNPVDGSNSYYDGMIIEFQPNFTNTDTSVANVNGAGNITLKKRDGATNLPPNYLLNTYIYKFIYLNGVFVSVSEEEEATTTTKGTALLHKQVTISNNSTDADHDLDFTSGNFTFDDGTGQALATAMTKQIDASWVAGTNQGGLFSGTVANNTNYYIFAIYNPATGVSDFGWDINTNGANAPSGFTKLTKLGSVSTNGSANIAFIRRIRTSIQDLFSGGSLSAIGYIKLPINEGNAFGFNTLIIQWGVSNTVEPPSAWTATFPIAFPNAVLQATLGNDFGPFTSSRITTLNTTTIAGSVDEWSGATNSGNVRYIAIGY